MKADMANFAVVGCWGTRCCNMHTQYHDSAVNTAAIALTD